MQFGMLAGSVIRMVTRLGANLLRCRDGADLLHQAEEVGVDPRFHNLAIGNAEDVDPSN